MTHPISPDRPEDTPALSYELRLMQTQAATGYFMPVPKHAPGFAETLSYLHDHPNDTFMHRYGLQLVMEMPFDQVREMAATAGPNRVLTALLMEAALTSEALMPLRDQFTPAMGSLYRQDAVIDLAVGTACRPGPPSAMDGPSETQPAAPRTPAAGV
jgi:hypothetical protein